MYARFLTISNSVWRYWENGTDLGTAWSQPGFNDAGWKTKRVIPFEDVTWIANEWFFAMRRAIVRPIRRTRPQVRFTEAWVHEGDPM